MKRQKDLQNVIYIVCSTPIVEGDNTQMETLFRHIFWLYNTNVCINTPYFVVCHSFFVQTQKYGAYKGLQKKTFVNTQTKNKYRSMHVLCLMIKAFLLQPFSTLKQNIFNNCCKYRCQKCKGFSFSNELNNYLHRCQPVSYKLIH